MIIYSDRPQHPSHASVLNEVAILKPPTLKTRLPLLGLVLLGCGLAGLFTNQAYATSPLNGNVQQGKVVAATCAACHSSGGRAGISGNDQYPNLAGQKVGYLVKQLSDFKSGKRTDPIMTAMASTLTTDNINDVAVYFASLK